MNALILAGGQGQRLRPYTTVLPKPLLPVGDKPILAILIHQLRKAGFDKITLAIGYLPELIRAYVDVELLGPVEYLTETEPSGTAGVLSRYQSDTDFLLVNGDTLTTLDFRRFMEYHRSSGGAMTIATHRREIKLEYGALQIEGTDIKRYREKPAYAVWASMGVYAFQPRRFSQTKIDIPLLVEGMLLDGAKIVAYRTDAFWLDIGTPKDYERAQEEYHRHVF